MNKADKLKGRLSVRPEVQHVTYHRQPTGFERKLGYGATHYRDFSVETACHRGTRVLKRWFKAEDDGLRYYR